MADRGHVNYILRRIDDVLEPHIHEDQKVAPWGVAPVTLNSAAGAFNWGAYSNDIIVALAETELFDLHWAVVADADTNGHYEIELYYGATDIVACQAAFTRTGPFTSSITIPLETHQLPIGARLRGRLRHSAGIASCLLKVYYHSYPP